MTALQAVKDAIAKHEENANLPPRTGAFGLINNVPVSDDVAAKAELIAAVVDEEIAKAKAEPWVPEVRVHQYSIMTNSPPKTEQWSEIAIGWIHNSKVPLFAIAAPLTVTVGNRLFENTADAETAIREEGAIALACRNSTHSKE